MDDEPSKSDPCPASSSLQEGVSSHVPQGDSATSAEVAAALAVLDSFHDEGWSRALEQEGLSFFTRDDEEGAMLVGMECMHDARTSWALAVPREFDLMHSWNEYLLNSKILDVPSLLAVTAYAEVWLPPPCYPRSMIFTAQGYDLLDEHGCLLMLIKSLDEPPPGVSLPASDADCYRARVLPGTCVKLVPLVGERVAVSLHSRVDLQFPVLPSWLLEWVVWVVGPYVHKEIQDRLNCLGDEKDPYRQRMTANPELYGMIERRCSEFLAKGSNVSNPEQEHKT